MPGSGPPKSAPRSNRPRTPVPARPADLRQANARELLQLLQQHEPCSKADLVRLSGLSAPSVSSMMAGLQASGLALSIGAGESSGGRRPEMLRFHAAHGYVAAADVGGTRIRMLLADLSGHPKARWSKLMGRGQKTPEAVCRLIHEGIREMCRASRIPQRKVLHLTTGAPGITDVAAGTVLAAPNLVNFNDVPLRQLLQKKIKVETIVENDVNLAAIGEHWIGAAQGIPDFLFIAVGTGVGAGVFVRGQIHHGAHWTAGEVGYLGVRHLGAKPLRVLDTGQLEDAIGGKGIELLWQELLERQSIADPALKGLHAPGILDLAGAGHATAREVLGKIAEILADRITDMALLLNPALVVLGGGVGAHPALCLAVKSLLDSHEFARPEVRSSVLGTEAQLFGAVSVSLRAVQTRLLA